LPGSGGGADIASLSQRLAIIMAHDRKRFPERVSFITSPGYGDGGDWRQRVGLPRGGPSVVITTLGTLGFAPDTHEMELRSWRPDVTADDVRVNTGWELRFAPDAQPAPAPTDDELRIIHECDPQGFWTR
ncbi:MAG TPA: CoA-transferase, partial [Ktedonobacterales bacterium]|nr:CoA-transferase [Ktedonobacterales bacterium]